MTVLMPVRVVRRFCEVVFYCVTTLAQPILSAPPADTPPSADAAVSRTPPEDTESAGQPLPPGYSISVHADPESTGPAITGEFVLDHFDTRNLSTVLADDPLRAVQALPGVSSNNDFEARFSLRGAGFDRVGVYVDGILLHGAVHNLEGTDLSGSAGVLESSAVREMRLYDDTYPERFADNAAAALNISLRDGAADRYHFLLHSNLAGSGLQVEGPLGRRCTSIGSFRKTYIQYLLADTLTDPSMAFGIQDTQARVSCRASSSSNVSIDLIDSHTDLDRRTIAAQLGVNALMSAMQRNRVVNAGWTFIPSKELAITTHAAWMNDSFDAQNPLDSPLGDGSYREWSVNSNLLWLWNSGEPFEAGWSSRFRSAAGFTENHDTVQDFNQVDAYRGADATGAAYLHQSWNLWNRLRLSAGGRWDHDSLDHATAFAPQAAAKFHALESLDFTATLGEFVQMPDITQLASTLGGPRLLPMRSLHSSAGLEYRLGQKTRLRVTAWQRRDRDLLFQPFLEPRLAGGAVFFPPQAPLYENSLSGRGRGYEAYLQRNMSRHIAGWISYSYGRTEMHDAVINQSFPSDQDQRHGLNAYASYAFSGTLDLSSRFTYGSGMPVPGFLTMENGTFYLAPSRNSFLLPEYTRLDFRVNKAWTRGKWTTRLFGEVLNATNHVNERFGSLDWYSPATGRAEVTMDTMFPILPNAGVEIER